MILLVLRLVSFSLGSSLLLAFVLALHFIIFSFFYLLVLASLMKTSLNLRKACYIATGVVEGAGF